MRFRDKFAAKHNAVFDHRSLTIAFLGDSVTHGCFECYFDPADNAIKTLYDQQNAYHEKLRTLLAMIGPSVSVNMINAGISGETAEGGLKRLARDVLTYQPDACVVCFGLNDICQGEAHLPVYAEALQGIFHALAEHDVEPLFMTPNMMAVGLSPHLDPRMLETGIPQRIQASFAALGDRYMDAARGVCESCHVPVCDCYAKWKQLRALGLDTDDLLSNYLNHPTRDMHWLFAWELFHTLMFEAE